MGNTKDDLYYKTFTEITVEKIYGDKAESRAVCEIKQLNNYDSNVEMNCTTDNNFIIKTEGVKITTNNTGYSKYVKFYFNGENEKIICPGSDDYESIIYNDIKLLFVLISLLLL